MLRGDSREKNSCNSRMLTLSCDLKPINAAMRISTMKNGTSKAKNFKDLYKMPSLNTSRPKIDNKTIDDSITNPSTAAQTNAEPLSIHNRRNFNKTVHRKKRRNL